MNYAAQMYEITADDTSVKVLATNQWIGNRGMTLDGSVLEVTFNSTLENSIKVTVEHFKGALDNSPHFELHEDSGFKPIIERKDGGYILTSGKTSVRIGSQGGGWDVKYYYDGKLLTKSGWRSTSYIKETEWRTRNRLSEKQGVNFYDDRSANCPATMREMLNISVGENIYGYAVFHKDNTA